jgi:hypothetical protein
MAGVCKACHSRAREEIDRALANGEPFRHIASRFRLSTTALQRHKKHIIALVRQVAQRKQDRIDLTNQEILEELTIQATYDPREFYNQWGALKDIGELPDRAAAAIRRVRSRDLYAGEGDQKSIVGRIDEIEWYDKHRALRTLAEIKGMLRPAEVQVNIHQQFLLTKSDEELNYFIEHHKWPGPNQIKQIGSGTTTTGDPGETGTSLER